eukprot:TRINITY_DN4866_c0_g1_i1.p1 TRINITY_DN4866_c0_g1~~TRINITY_DN4866_c0_g1_i1.p1  ORF type:complete len:291 (-),score=51.99 TRINITY_DN4866_c0_g1_i1:40-879(-)
MSDAIAKKRDNLNKFQPTDHEKINIILFGETGMGKSSVINNASSALDMKGLVIKRAEPRPLDLDNTQQKTVHYVEYPLTERISMWDTFGWSPSSNYIAGEFEAMLDGRVTSKTHMNSINPATIPEYGRVIHSVVFVLDRLATELSEHIKALRPYYETAKKRGKHVVIAITKLDEGNQDLRLETDPEKLLIRLEEDATLTKIRSLVMKSWETSNLTFFPVLNYKAQEQGKKPHLENTVLEMLLYLVYQNPIEVQEEDNEEGYDWFAGEEPVLAKFYVGPN